MLHLYDEAIAQDLEQSFNKEVIGTPIVKVMDSELGFGPIAQACGDIVSLPMILLTRYPDTSVDKSRINFTRMHRGVNAVIDLKTNEIYNEKVIPVELSYDLTILAANTVDRDELARELIFKYTDMYFITFTLPYECNRKVSFGVKLDVDKDISNKSGTSDYFDSGTVYQTVIPLKCEGCVLVSYTSAKLTRTTHEIVPDTHKEKEP